MSTSNPRYTVSVNDELFQEIERFRFEHKYSTRSQATVELIRIGIEKILSKEGVNPLDQLFSALEQAHIQKYRILDEHGKKSVDFALDHEYSRCSKVTEALTLVARGGENEIVHVTPEQAQRGLDSIEAIKEKAWEDNSHL